MLKICSKCNIPKVLDAFYLRKKNGTARHSHCIECSTKTQRLWRLNNSERCRTIKKNTYLKNPKVLYIKQYLNTTPCVDCGNSDVRVLQFDHVRDFKQDNVSLMSRHSKYSLEDIVREIAKCEVRCANCHIIRHCEEGDRNRQTIKSRPYTNQFSMLAHLQSLDART